METSAETGKKYERTDENRALAKETRRKDNESHFSQHVKGGGEELLILSHLFPKQGVVKDIAIRAMGAKEGLSLVFNYVAPDGGGMNTVFEVEEGINSFKDIPVLKHGLVHISFATDEDKFKVNDLYIAYIFKTNQ